VNFAFDRSRKYRSYKALEIFKEQKIHYAFVVYEYRSVNGMISMDDIIDALIGDVSKYNQNEYTITQRGKKPD
jgi:putative hemolysin